MCEGVALFANNTKALYGKKTNSHSDAAKALHINEDEWRKFEYHFWDSTVSMDHYDAEAEKILSHIDPIIATRHAKALAKREFSTVPNLCKWLKDVPSEFHHIRRIKDDRRRNLVLKTLFGKTEKEYAVTLGERNKQLESLYKRIREAHVFHPKPELSKKEIQLKVDFSLGFLNLPKVGIKFK